MKHRLLLLIFLLSATIFKSQTGSTNLFPGCMTWTVVKPSCNPGCDGIIMVTLPNPTCFPGGPYTLPYTIGVAPSGTCASPAGSGTYNPGTYTIATNACACLFTYFISISDDSGNLFDFANVPVTAPSIQRTPGTTASVTCAGACTGSVSQTYFNATAPYSFTINPPGGPSSFSSSPGPLVTPGLCAGVMTINVQDTQGCNATFTNNIPGPPPFSWGAATTSVNCFGVCNGVAAVSPTGATSGYTINWSTGATSVITSGQTSSVSGLCAGAVVTASITDSKGCTYTPTTSTIAGPPQLTVTLTQTNVTCAGGSNGVAVVTVTGGIAPYTYTWSPGPGNTPTLSGLPVGTQTVTIANNSGQCVTTRTFNITGPPNFTLTPNITNVSCNGGGNGSATLAVSGGNGGPYSYTWTPTPPSGQGTGTVSGLTPGTYTINVRDALNCATLSIITITAPPAYTVSTITQTLVCFGVCTGGGSVSVSGSNGAPYGFTWTPAPPMGQGTGTISNLCVGNYTANITDAAGCPTTAIISITQPSSITPNVTSSSITCNGVCNGVINAAPTGGNAPYTYTLLTPTGGTVNTNPPFNGLCVGVHTLIVAGATGCPQTFTINMTQPNPLIGNIATTSVTCFNSCNGTLAGNVVGGTPGYTLVWTTPSGTVAGNALAGQCAGNYVLNIMDANSCTATASATLTQPTQVTATINPTNPTCFGLCNGILNASVAGGVPGYTLNWSNGFTGNPNTNLCAGNYTLTVIDANSCNRTFTTTLTGPPAITVTANTSSPSCAGSCNGAATITATGGTPGFTFQCNVPPITTNVSGIFTGFCSGNYLATVTDANGCNQPVNFSINNPPALSIAISSLQTSCNACTGAGTVTPSGGTPTYAVVWTNSVGTVVGNSTTVSGLCPGNYTVVATDAASCSITNSLQILQTVNVSVLIAGSGIQCNGACTGSAVATATGGTIPYTYSWSPNGQITATATGMCPGTHTVLVTDLIGCSNTGTIVMNNPPALTVTASQTNITCFGSCNGVISATATGGTGSLSYSWAPGGQTTSSITGLCAGAYTLTVTDANNCTSIQSFSITENPALTATFAVTNPTGCAVPNGSICVTAGGGNNGPYTFTWSPGGSNMSCITGLGAGVYSVIVSDGVCQTTLSTSMTNPSGPTLAVTAQSVACFGASTGSVAVVATGIAPFTFSWSPAISFTSGVNTSSAVSLPSNTYIVSVEDGNNCITSQSITITQPTSLTVNTGGSNPLCNASCNGSITLVTSGATPGYTFAWLPGGVTGQGTQTISSLCAGGYTVNITDANGCAQTRTFNLVAPPALTLTNTFSNVQCFGMCNGSIVANGSGGTAPLSYSWIPVGGFGGAITPTVLALCPNTYTVIVTDNNGCTATNTVTLTQPPALTSTLTSLNVSCSNSCNATATHVASGGTPTYTFMWSGSPLNTQTIGGMCPGNYSATVIDGNGCITVKPFTVTAPAPFNATLTPTSPLCNAGCNGSITTTLSGAQGTVSFNWSPAGSGQNPTGLCPNNYTLIAIDANSCQVTAVATLTNPPAVLANITTTNPACNGNCNGVAVSNATNVTAPVNYTWFPAGPNSATNTALCDGNYTVVVQDANGCQDTQTFALTSPPASTINPAVTPASCGASNGSITVVIAGGTPTFAFVWMPPGPTGSVATNLGAGIYSVTVTDVNGCTNTVSIPLSNANGPSVTPVSASSINCNGICNGGATVNVGGISGGAAPYNVSWLMPPAPSTLNPLSGLCAGTYTAQITDNSSPANCISFTAVTVAQPPAITVTPSFTLPSCNGICNGSISLNTSGGTPGYTYTWSPAGSVTDSYSNACAGNYTVTIIDNNSCPSTQTVVLPAAQNMTATIANTNNLCFSNCAGTASVTSIVSGLAPYNYSWSNGQVGSGATALCSGIYTVTITDANSCFNQFTTTITSPPALTASTAISSPSCGLCNGIATATAVGGQGPAYTYSWSSGAVGQTANNLCAGLYQVLITDANNCSQIQDVLISSSSGITGETFIVQNETCAGLCNGSITVNPIGGAPVITYSWISPPSVSNTLTNLCAGNYIVQMTDADGCIRTASTAITAANALTLSPFVTQPSCSTPNGSISVVAAGGNPGYTYNWLPGGSTSSVITGLGAGIYTVTVTDNNGCAKVQAFTVNNSNSPVITFTQSNINCFNACTGSITALGTSTAGPVTYSWSTGSNSQTVTNLCKGIVTLTVSAGGCNAFQQFTLTDNPAMQLSISNIIQPQCNGDCNGEITLIPSGGVLPYTFTWSPSATSNPQTSLCAGGYTATVTDSRGCPVTTTMTLVDPPLLVITNTLNNSTCSSAADGSATITTAGGTPTFSFVWTGPNSFTANTQAINNIIAGTYTVDVTDARGCTQSNTLQIVPTITIEARAGRDTSFCALGSVVLNGTNSIGAFAYNWYMIPLPSPSIANTATTIVAPPPGTATYVLEAISSVSACVDMDTVVVTTFDLPFVDAGPSYTIPVFSTVVIGGQPTSPTAISYSWAPGATLDNYSIPNPVASNTMRTVYVVNVEDLNGCRASDTVVVDLYPEVIIPNGFSPNGDSKNDRWIIDYIEQFPENTVEVYNRWGEQLFYSQGYTVPFDGRYKGKDLPVGTYYYVINLNHPAYTKPYTGPLTIFR